MEDNHNQLDSLIMVSCFRETLASLIPPCCLCADALVLVHHRQVHVGDSYLSGHLHFQLHVREHSYDSQFTGAKHTTGQQLKFRIGEEKKKRETKSYLNMVGNQTAVPSHRHGKVVIATGWLAGHEIQLKEATKSQEKERFD